MRTPTIRAALAFLATAVIVLMINQDFSAWGVVTAGASGAGAAILLYLFLFRKYR